MLVASQANAAVQGTLNQNVVNILEDQDFEIHIESDQPGDAGYGKVTDGDLSLAILAIQLARQFGVARFRQKRPVGKNYCRDNPLPLFVRVTNSSAALSFSMSTHA